MNYFELFNIPIGFSIDPIALNRSYITLQKQFHPDFFGKADENEKAFALEKSSMINKAYRTFKSTDLTIQYFLEIKGLKEEGELYKMPPDFLMEVMEINELKMDGAEKQEIELRSNALQQTIYSGVKELIENYNDEKAVKADWLRIKDYYYKKKYIDRLLAE